MKHFGLSYVTAIALSLLVGCSAGPATVRGHNLQRDDGFMTYTQMVAQYESSQADFPLPEGKTFPPFPSGYDKSGSYQALYGDAIAFGVYQCSWQMEWLNWRSADAERAQAALDILMAIPDNTVFQQTFNGRAQAVFRDAYDAASLGNPTKVQQLANASC